MVEDACAEEWKLLVSRGVGEMKQFGPFRLDTSNECLWHEGKQIPLPPRPFMVLRHLVENPGRLISHDELLDALWPETYVQPQVLRTYMLELRKVLGDDAAEPHFIQTLPKRGYCFVATVSECDGMDRGAARKPAEGDARQSEIAGREEELGRLTAEVAVMEGGQRRIVFVTGEAGIGKTALVDCFCRQMQSSRRISVARGQCVEGFGAKEEYYPVMEALGQLCSSAEGAEVCAILARLAPAWLAALGRQTELNGARPAAQERMPGDLCAALEEWAAAHPLILVLEDLHWADDSTLNLISALARRRAAARLMILATCGPGDTAPEHPLQRLKQNLVMRQLSTEIALAPLTQGALSTLLSRELHQDTLPAGLTAFVHQHSEGNPLFAIAILEHLIARRFLLRDEGAESAAWRPRASFAEMEADVPDRLAQMIELEIACLSAEEQRILGAGSVMGVAFPAWAVAAALEQDTAKTEDACEDLTRRLHYLERAGQDELPDGTRSEFYVFVHGLYREVLYQRQSATRRAQWHLRIAKRLGELFAGCAASVARELAMHYEAGGDWHSAAGALRIAARNARERQAHHEAAQLLEHALELAERLSGAEREAAAADIRRELDEPGGGGARQDRGNTKKNLTISG